MQLLKWDWKYELINGMTSRLHGQNKELSLDPLLTITAHN